jgi:hypothetical protein
LDTRRRLERTQRPELRRAEAEIGRHFPGA